MVKNFKCNNTSQILAAARCGIAIPVQLAPVFIKRKKDKSVILPIKKDYDTQVRERLINYYGEPTQNISKRARM